MKLTRHTLHLTQNAVSVFAAVVAGTVLLPLSYTGGGIADAASGHGRKHVNLRMLSALNPANANVTSSADAGNGNGNVPLANATSTSTEGSYGWSYVPTVTLGKGETIVGIAASAGNASGTSIGTLKVFVRKVESFAGGGWNITHEYQSAAWNPKTDTLSAQRTVKNVPSGYRGNIRLEFPTLLPTRFQTQPVKVERVTKADKTVVVKWPTAIPLYGSAQTPQTTVPGLLDNEILGQSHEWLWVALKGPQYPPMYPHSGPLLTGFRYWNRLVALNLKTGAYRLYSIPRSYALYQMEAESPSMAVVHGEVYVGVGSWIGAFPGDPTISGDPTTSGNSGSTSATSATSGAASISHSVAIVGNVPILHPAPSSVIARNGRQALAGLSELNWQAINGLAAYWNSVMGKRVSGMPQYRDGDGPGTWNTMPTVANHGVLPIGLVWAMEYPFRAGFKEDKERNQMEKLALSILQTKLNGAASSVIPTTYRKVRKSFGDHAPMTLPGYTIRDNVYWPNSKSVLNRGAAPLPADFPTYASVEDSVGALLATRSATTVIMPTLAPPFAPGANGDSGKGSVSPSRLLNPPKGSFLDVQYQVNQGQVPNGYSVTVSIGAKAPANSPKLSPGNAEMLYSLAGVPRGTPLPKSFRWPASAVIPGGEQSRVSLGHGIVATVWSGTFDGVKAKGVTWKQDGLTWIIPPSTWSSVNPLKDARTKVAELAANPMPAGATGYGIFAYGSDMPSQVVFHLYFSTYVLYTTGWRAAQMASLMNWAP